MEVALAGAALGAALQVLFQQILGKIPSDFRVLPSSAKEDLEQLQATLKRFEDELRKAELMKFKSARTEDWYRRLHGVANEAKEILYDALDSDNPHEQVGHPSIPHLAFNPPAIYALTNKIKSVTRKFDLLDVEKGSLDFEANEISTYRETSSNSSETEVVGRNEDKDKIINSLLNDANVSPPFVYAIVGMGGIGKTTLAQLIYNDNKVEEEFKGGRIWVWVSQKFDVKEVMKAIIQRFSGKPCELKSLESIQSHLKQSLPTSKFLLVLDDIWNENLDDWNKLKSSLKSGAIGSSILLTTCEPGVASIAGVHDRLNLALLSEVHCWSIFKESSSLQGGQENGELEHIGKEIVKNFGGLPLAAKILGQSLSLTIEVDDWKSKRDGDIWKEKGEIFRALQYSFDSPSMDCFAFSTIFRKGSRLDKEHLIHLWMANGLVPSRQESELEDMGNKIFKKLVLKFLFEVSQDCVKINDLMHDLGRSFFNECFCLEGPDVSAIPPRTLYLSISNSSLSNTILGTVFKSHPSLRTCILVEDKQGGSLPKKIVFKNLDCLRALDLRNTIMNNLPVSIGKSKHLRYLNLSRTDLKELPDRICTLTKLETLKLGGCKGLTRLPNEIAQLTNLSHLDLCGCESLIHLPGGIPQMTNLRHLDICFCSKLTELPNGMGQLVCLRTLGLFIVGRENGQRITELQRMNQLRGRLEIKGLEHVKDAKEAVAILKGKKNVSSLSLIWGYSQESNDEADSVFQALQPPQSLNEKLVIKGYGGSVFASWMKLLENLVEIELRDCIKCEHLPPLGQLSNLKVLTIVGLKSLKSIGLEFYDSTTSSSSGTSSTSSSSSSSSSNNNSSSSDERRKIFPSLEKLKFEDMLILEEWNAAEVEDSLPACSCLKTLELLKCPMLTVLPSGNLSFVQKLVIEDCDKVIVSLLSSLTSLQLNGNGTNNVTLFPDGSFQNLDALEYLKINSYYELISLPDEISNLSSLRTLEIVSCPALESLPVIGNSLVNMHIRECASLKSLSESLQHLSTLHSLTVKNCDELKFSSDDFQNLISLQTLCVGGLLNCTSFPSLHNLSTLQTLSISDCENLKLGPQAMQKLTVLEKLIFSNCEQLEISSADLQDLVNLRSITFLDLPKLISIPECQHFPSLQNMIIQQCNNFVDIVFDGRDSVP